MREKRVVSGQEFVGLSAGMGRAFRKGHSQIINQRTTNHKLPPINQSQVTSDKSRQLGLRAGGALPIEQHLNHGAIGFRKVEVDELPRGNPLPAGGDDGVFVHQFAQQER